MSGKSKKVLIALQFLQIIFTTGFLGMPENLVEWIVRLCQSIVAFCAGWIACSTIQPFLFVIGTPDNSTKE
jgi:hypothetical protein